MRKYIGEHPEILTRGDQPFRELVENSPNALVVVRGDGRIERVNAEAERLFGYSREELIGRPVEILVPERLRSGHAMFRAAYMQSPQARPMGAGRELVGRRKDGSEVPVEIALTPVEFSSGTSIVATITDITQRKKADETLRRERDRARKYFDLAGVIMLVLDREGRIRQLNRRGCQVLGVSAEELIGRDWVASVLPKPDQQRVRELFDGMMRGEIEPTGVVENAIIRGDGQERVILWHNALLYDSSGRITGTLSSGEDITDRKQAEDALRQADQMKADFIRIASHELRTPVSYILSMVRLLSRVSDADRLARGLDGIRDKASRLNDIILTMFKLTPGELRPERMQYGLVSLAELLEDIRKESVVFLEERRQRMNIEIAQNTPAIQADPDKIRDVLENLLMNAIKFTPDDGVVSVTVTRLDRDHVQIAVCDQGKGISPTDMAHLFEPFYTGGEILQHSTGVWQFGKAGVGLGLAIVRQFVLMHGGSIDVQTSPQGSTFTVTLPVHRPHAGPHVAHGAGI